MEPLHKIITDINNEYELIKKTVSKPLELQRFTSSDTINKRKKDIEADLLELSTNRYDAIKAGLMYFNTIRKDNLESYRNIPVHVGARLNEFRFTGDSRLLDDARAYVDVSGIPKSHFLNKWMVEENLTSRKLDAGGIPALVLGIGAGLAYLGFNEFALNADTFVPTAIYALSGGGVGGVIGLGSTISVANSYKNANDQSYELEDFFLDNAELGDIFNNRITK